MELFYCFFLGPVAVAGIITNSRKKNGDIISPINKSIEIKPGVLLSFNGPHEDNMEYMEFFKKMYDRYPDTDGNQMLEELKNLIGKEEIDTQGFFDLMTNMMKNVHKMPEEKQNRLFEELKNHPVSKMMEGKQKTLEENLEISKSITVFDIIEASSKGFIHYRGTESDIFTRDIKKYSTGDCCYLHFGSIPIDDSQDKNAGQNVLDLNKKMKQYIPQAKKNNPYGATILKNVITEFHLKNIKNPQELLFLQVGPHTNYRWVPLTD